MGNYESLFSSDSVGVFQVSENLITTKCKAKYAKDPDGNLRIISVQEFSQPRFRPSGWELPSKKSSTAFDGADGDIENDILLEEAERFSYENKIRAVRRAKIACFDFILCNPDLDAFCTFTLDPKKVQDRTDWKCAYQAIRNWLSNRVQRRGLKYILVPEYHKDGKSIHFHAVMNSTALSFREARYPSGRLIKDKGQQVYNVEDYTAGFSTMKLISGENAQDKVAKYIFKYMGKQMGSKISGRYYLHGGDLVSPILKYADSPDELIPDGSVPKHTKNVEITCNLSFKEQFFI